MHEFSICEALLRQVTDIAAAHRAERATLIRLRIGALSGVEPALLERAFTLARTGTVAATAELAIVGAAVEIACRGCGATAEVAANSLRCPSCGAIDVRVTSGDDLILESVELDVADDLGYVAGADAVEREASSNV